MRKEIIQIVKIGDCMKLMIRFYLLLFIVANVSQGQIIFEENFDYAFGSLLTSNGYTVSSGAGVIH